MLLTRNDCSVADFRVTWQIGVFAYNEVPTIAVAIACWFRARQHLTRPFFMPSLL